MDFMTNKNDTFAKAANFSPWLQTMLVSQSTPSPAKISFVQNQYKQQYKPLSCIHIIEISLLCLILIENLVIFMMTYCRKLRKRPQTETNDQQQSQHHRIIIFPQKTLIYNCLHRNWMRAYSFTNACLSLVYFVILLVKHYHPNLLHYSSITFYSLPLALVQQILINFSTFHLLIISISILQYFIRYYRAFEDKYSLNISNNRSLLITKHTNVALILSGSLALIFGYNYIFYSPKYSHTFKLLPLITLNMILLPLIDFIIIIIIIVCVLINLYRQNCVMKHDQLLDSQLQPQSQQQQTLNSLRAVIERSTCAKCYSKFIQQNRNIFSDADLYSNLHKRVFGSNLISSTRPSLAPSEEKRKYSTLSYENIPIINDANSHLRASYPCQINRNFLINKTHHSTQDFTVESHLDKKQNSANDLFLPATLKNIKQQRSYCRICYHLLLLFLLKYALFTLPQHMTQMLFYVRQFYEFIIKQDSLSQQYNSHSIISRNNLENILSQNSEFTLTICRFLFLCARIGDTFLLTRLPNLIKKYFPCGCRCNSKILCQKPSLQRPSHQILVRNTDLPMNESFTGDDITNQKLQEHKQSSNGNQHAQKSHHHLRLQFQFIPLCSKQQRKPPKENC